MFSIMTINRDAPSLGRFSPKLLCSFIVLLGSAHSVGATEMVDCPSEALAYGRKLVQSVEAGLERADRLSARNGLQQVVETCPRFEFLMALGQVELSRLAESQFGSEDPDTPGALQSTRATALRSFARAQEGAPDDDSRAEAIGRMGEALTYVIGSSPEEDSKIQKRALDYLHLAMKHHSAPQPDWLVTKTREIDERGATDRIKDLRYGMFGPDPAIFEMNALPRKDALAAEFAGAESSSGGGTDMGVRSGDTTLHLLFEFDSTRLVDEASLAQVDALARTFMADEFKQSRIRIVGHTDCQGSEAYNQRLSERRAQKVWDLIVDKHPELEERMRWEGRGEQDLIYKGDGSEDHRLNRRVEVFVEVPVDVVGGSF